MKIAISALTYKFEQRGLKAIFYTNPSTEKELTDQNEFTIINAIQMPIILFSALLLQTI